MGGSNFESQHCGIGLNYDRSKGCLRVLCREYCYCTCTSRNMQIPKRVSQYRIGGCAFMISIPTVPLINNYRGAVQALQSADGSAAGVLLPLSSTCIPTALQCTRLAHPGFLPHGFLGRYEWEALRLAGTSTRLWCGSSHCRVANTI